MGVWSGQAQDLVFDALLFENDGGNPVETKDKVHRTNIGIWTPNPPQPTPNWPFPASGSIFEHLFGSFDDSLGRVSRTFGSNELNTLVWARNSEERGISHDFFAMFTGQGSPYKAYFDVVLA